jgi:hypothetical protein
VIEIATKVSDVVIGLRKGDGGLEVSLTDERHFFLEFDHGALDEKSQDADGDSADDDGSGSGEQEQGVAVGIAQGEGSDGEKDQAGEEHEHNGQDCLDLPIDAYVVHCGIPPVPDQPIPKKDMHVVFQSRERTKDCAVKRVNRVRRPEVWGKSRTGSEISRNGDAGIVGVESKGAYGKESVGEGS